MNRYIQPWFALLLLLFAFGEINNFSPPRAVAQEDEAEVAAPGAHDAAPTPHKSRLWWFIKSSGVIGLFIFGLSMYFVATTIRLFVELRPVVAQPPEDEAQVDQFLGNRNFQGLYENTLPKWHGSSPIEKGPWSPPYLIRQKIRDYSRLYFLAGRCSPTGSRLGGATIGDAEVSIASVGHSDCRSPRAM